MTRLSRVNMHEPTTRISPFFRQIGRHEARLRSALVRTHYVAGRARRAPGFGSGTTRSDHRQGKLLAARRCPQDSVISPHRFAEVKAPMRQPETASLTHPHSVQTEKLGCNVFECSCAHHTVFRDPVKTSSQSAGFRVYSRHANH